MSEERVMYGAVAVLCVVTVLVLVVGIVRGVQGGTYPVPAKDSPSLTRCTEPNPACISSR